jgi:prolyl oligopeptidase
MKTFVSLPAYPHAPRSAQADVYHETSVPDPFRPLEDLDAPSTVAWVAAENAVTEALLSTVPQREAIRERLRTLWDYERYSVPSREGTYLAYFKNDGLQNQAVLYATPSLDIDARVVLDPNAFSDDGTVALSGIAFSHDGAYVAYAISTSGSDWQEWHVRDVATTRDLPDVVCWGKFSGAAWRHDGSGFYYGRYDEPDPSAAFKEAHYFHKVYFHALGTTQDKDVLIYERPDHKEWHFQPQVTDDGRWLILHTVEGSESKSRLFVADIHHGDASFVALAADGDASYVVLGNDGSRFYLQTTHDAPRGKIVSCELGETALTTLVDETPDTLQSAVLFDDRFVITYLHDAHSVVRIVGLDGRPLDTIALPGLGSVDGFLGRRSDRITYFRYNAYTTPATIFRYDIASATAEPIFSPRVAFDPSDYVSEQHMYASKDGTRIPMIVSSKRGVPRDGTQPVILYGYGGFDVSLTPAFSPAVLVWLEMGGAYAVANLRGGGEYGEAWHEAGMREKKQNVFDDFIAGAEYLIAERFTSREKLAIMGGSNGGLLVGAVMTQRPDLCAAALPAVGVMDMLRFQTFTIGWAWMPEYGSSDDATMFPILLGYSPLHNLRDGVAYPATLVTTADHDDRVFPAHSFKFAARLQEAHGGEAPVLIRIEEKAGHGAGKPTSKLIDEAADRYAFLTHVLNMS